MSKKKTIKAYKKLQEAFMAFKTAINEAEEAGLSISVESQCIDDLEENMLEIAEENEITDYVE